MIDGSARASEGARIPELDGFRGLAILMVIAAHYLAIGVGDSEILRPFAWMWALAWTGVDLFFVLSGFLIGGILLDHQKSKNLFKAFFTRRICRIFPLYFAFVALFFVIRTLVPEFKTTFPIAYCFETIVPSWSYFAFLQNVFVAKLSNPDNEWMRSTWSLAAEEQFYITLPFVIRFAARRFLPWILIGITLMAPILRLYFYIFYPGGEIATYFLLPCRVDTLMAGVLCAYAVRNEKIRRYLTPSFFRIGGTLALVLFVYVWFNANSPIEFEMVSWGHSAVAIIYGFFLLTVVTSPPALVSRFLRFTWLRKLGEISFGVYLFHFPMNSLWHYLWLGRDSYITTFSDIPPTICALISSILLAWVSWKIFEKPIVDFGHRIKYSEETVAPAATSRIVQP